MNIFADAIRAAQRSTIRTHKTGAAIYARNGDLLTIGWSHVTRPVWTETPWFMHAEHHALVRLATHRWTKGDPYRITVATLTRGGDVTCGNPCAACARKLEAYGIKIIETTQRLGDA